MLGVSETAVDAWRTVAGGTPPPAGQEAPPTEPSPSRVALAVHLCSLALGFGAVMFAARNLWFFYDDWDFLSASGPAGGPGLLSPHNGHWSTIPMLVDRGLEAAVGLHGYLPYMAVLVSGHVVLAHLLWRWMLRAGAQPWVATPLVVMFLFLGAGWQDLLWAFQIGFIGALAFGAAAVLLVDHDGAPGPRDLGALLLAAAALMCSGVGVVMVVVAGATALLRRRWAVGAAVVGIPAAVYLAWLVATRHQQVSPGTATPSQLLQVPDFVWTGLTGALETATGMTGAGAVLLLAMAALLLRRWQTAPTRVASACAAALGAVLFLTLTGWQRIGVSLDAAAWSRYSYVTCALLLVPAGVVLAGLGRRRPAVGAVIVAVLLGATAHGAGLLITHAREQVALVQQSKARVLAAASLIRAGSPLLGGPQARPDPDLAPQLSEEGLRRLVASGALPTNEVVSHAAELDVALQLQVALLRVSPAGDTAPLQLDAVSGATVSPLQAGCLSVASSGDASRVRLLVSQPGSVAITPAATGTLRLWLGSADDATGVSGPRAFTLGAGGASHLAIARAGASAVISLPPGANLLCGLR
jgi:hypothetical protein